MPAIVANSEDTLRAVQLSLWLGVDVPKRSKVIREIFGIGIEHLNASIVLAVEWSNGARTASLCCVLRVVKPQTQVVKLDRISRGIRRGVRKRSVVEHEREPAVLAVATMKVSILKRPMNVPWPTRNG